MKRLFCFLLLLSGFSHWGQQKEIKIEWGELAPFSNLESGELYPYFESPNYDFNPVNGKLNFHSIIENEKSIDVSSLKISNVRYKNLTVSELGALHKYNLPTTLDAVIKKVSAREDVNYILSFNPIIKEGGSYKRVESLSYSYSSGVNRDSRYSTFKSAARVNSVLKTGNWFKFSIVKTGVYKISKQYLRQLGVPDNINPSTIKIYGSGGEMLPLINQDNYQTDLVENAIYIKGEEDGVFNDDDYILFYGIGVDQWSDENLTHLNLYENEAFYFLTFSGGDGKRIQMLNQPSGSASKVYTTYDASVFHENDLVNVGNLGRKWFGERFNMSPKQSFSFELMNLDKSIPIQFLVNAASSSYGNTSFSYSVNQQDVGRVSFSKLSGQTISGFESFLTKEMLLSSESVQVDVNYNNGGVPTSEGYLDYIQLDYTAILKGGAKQYGFTNNNLAFENGVVEYRISNASTIKEVWDVTDPSAVEKVNNPNQGVLSFKVYGGVERNFHVLNEQDYYEPLQSQNSRVSNQDVKGAVFSEGDVDYLIVTKSSLRNAAERLADFHKKDSGLKVKVVILEELYNEFSSGKQDVAAIRNFVRYVYQNATSETKKLKYLNLFGEASFDYKNRIPNNKNTVPVFYGMSTIRNVINSASNFSSYTTFMSDDFYVQMDDGEGLMSDVSYGLDLSVGRMLVSTPEMANAMIEKLEDYSNIENQGRWRNTIVALADDVDRESDIVLQSELNSIVDTLVAQHPFFNVKKIFMDSYTQETSAGGKRYPKAKEEFINSIESGSLYVSYLGHGGEDGLAQERIFGIEDAGKLNNFKKYPLFVTITCEFTRFDNPYRLTGGERMYLNKRGGAIALVATTREIGIEAGRQLNKEFSQTLFNKEGVYPTVSEALMLTKNKTFSRDKNVVFYIGDPAMRLAIPKPKVVLTEINDKPLDADNDALEALGYIRLGGKILDENDNFLSNFSGDLAVQIFDKNIDRKTLGNDGVVRNGELVIMDFQTLGETIFRGNASVTNGLFNFDFVVPKDINISKGKGKVSFYAKDVKQDYTGHNSDILIGGVNKDAPDDKTSPIVSLYMDNEAFVSGGITTDAPVFLVFLEDENGINTASGIGHDIVAYLDGDERSSFVLNDYYETEADNFRKGKITYPFKDLEEGLHTLTFKVWDVYNNLTTSELQFIVAKNEGVSLEKVLNYPNPFVNYTEFWFEHNRPYETLNVQVQIMTITGKIVKTINQTVLTEGKLSREIVWDGKDDFGDRIGKGVYIYKLTVQSTLTKHQSEKIEKLVIL
ncbi:type IX secretion system sortase PorU [Myroides guanonis]|uniref:Peptidase family C25 n=1 Tax=Myroides guanonis TaxID=1150112 RepID=A0A1I3NKZ4_9FLAO|nr:type IX secretion system sortase PorU [Myroides guanonis]SFJ09436.1 Peptidase family C25 [Myroides guanonis]